MKWVLIAVFASLVSETLHAWPSCGWGDSPPPAGFVPGFGGPFGSYQNYSYPTYYGSYPYRPLHTSGLFPTYGASGNAYRTWPYYPAYAGAYPYSYSYSYRYNPYSVYSKALRTGAAGPEVLYLYQLPKRSDGLEDVDKTWAWGYLADGNFDRASTIFAAMERQNPGAGWPKIGNGLLAGFSGDYRKAVYQFRRAFRFDPSDPGRLPEKQHLQDRLESMSAHFKREANGGSRPDPDAEFMVAALAFLSGDDIGAQNAIEKAEIHGDDSRSARNLKKLVGFALEKRDQELLAAEQRWSFNE